MNDGALLGKVLGSAYDEDGFLCVQIETFGSGKKSVGWFELSSVDGSQSRPLDPDESGHCQAYYRFDGARGYATLANDPRTQGLLPQCQKGEKFLFGPSGAFIRFKADGSISIFTTDDNTTNGRSVFLTVAPTGLLFNFPYGKLAFDSTGFHVLTNSGARLDLGAIAAPAPLNALSSYATLSAAMVHVNGSAVSVGPAAGVSAPVARSDATLVALQALATGLEGLSAALTAIAGLTTSPGAAGAAAATAAALVVVAQAAITASALTIPSGSTAST